MSVDFDRFLAGEGALASLLRKQPAFEPPARLFERVMTALDAAAPGQAFEPPASLEAAVLAEAARLDTAQQPRRQALLDDLARGTDVAAAMGTAVSDTTSRWLSQQVPSGTPATEAPAKRRRPRWLGGLGVAVTAALAASVALKVWFDPTAPRLSGPPGTLDAARMAPAPASPAPVDKEAPPRSLAIAEPAAESSSAPAPRQLSAPAAPAKPAAKAAPQAFAEREKKQTIGAVAPESLPPPAPRPVEERVEVQEDMISESARADAAAAGSASLVLRSPANAGVARSSRPVAPTLDWEVPVDIASDTLAARLEQLPPGNWQLQVAPQDEEAGQRLAAALTRHLHALGRPDTVEATVDRAQAPGRVQITDRRLRPAAPRSPTTPPPPPSAIGR